MLVHGITGGPAEMKPLHRKLQSSGFRVVCPQLAGHCSTLRDLKKTTWRDWYASVDDALSSLRETCDTVFVSGLSMGALLALKLAANRPDDVQGVATLSATFFYDGWNVPQWKQRFLLPIALYTPLRFLYSWREPAPYGIKDERIRSIIASMYASDSANLPEKYGYPEFPGVTIRETFRLIGSAKRDLERIVSPMLIVHATEDDMASVRNAHYLASSVSSQTVETYFVDDTYHVLTLDKRKNDVAARVSGFFEAIASQKTAVAEALP